MFMTAMRFVVLLVAAASSLPAQARSEIDKAPPASWIELVDLPKADPKFDRQIKNGTSNLLSDFQIRHRPDGYEVFERSAYRIVDRSGLDRGATISIEFDPATRDVTMNRINIIRDGVVVDRLADAKFDIFRREKDAEKGLFDGWLTAYVNINDVRVGDIIDYATTSVVKPIVGPGLMFHSVAMAWDEPVALIREKVIWPTSQPLAIRASATEIRPEIRVDGPDTTYSWRVVNPEPVTVEDYLPADFPSYPKVQLSSTPRWQDVIDAVLPYYRLDQTVPAAFAAKLNDIAVAYARPQDRLVETMRLVQDSIRYVSLSMGRGSYIPRSPGEVVASGFGDCKDKALLLASSLRRLGIEAHVALTDLDAGEGLERMLPTLRAFDHVIVKAVIDHRIYWIDATNYLQGGRADNLVAPDYGYALPILADKAILERIEVKDLLQPTTFITEQFEFPKRKGDPLKLSVNTVYRDADADNIRYRLIARSAAKIADDYIQYYNRQYPGMRSTGGLAVDDDRDGNVVSVRETYELPADALVADDLIENFPLKADIGLSKLPEPNSYGRKGPVWLGSPMFYRHKVVVRNLKAKFVGPDEYEDVITPYVAFKARWSSTKTEFDLDWFFTTLNRQVPAKDLRSYLKSLKKMNDGAGWTYNFAYSDAEAN
jgi:transglutaminase-like putative cysteine protease